MNNYEKRDIFIILIVAIVTLLLIWGLYIVIDDASKRTREWNEKVNMCIMNEHCRPDCKLILYKDMQNHNMQLQQNQTSSMTTGIVVGTMVGSSMARR